MESDPRRRCAYLVAGLLPKDFTADDLIQFAANRRREPSPDTTYAEWELTPEGNAELTAGVRRKPRQGPEELARSRISIFPQDSKSTAGKVLP